MRGTTLSMKPPDSKFPWRPAAAFQWRVLRYLEWFGLMAKDTLAANDDWRSPYVYSKTPLFDRFLSFHL